MVTECFNAQRAVLVLASKHKTPKPVSIDTQTPKPVSIDTQTPKPVSIDTWHMHCISVVLVNYNYTLLVGIVTFS